LRVQQHQKAIEGRCDAAAMAAEHPGVLQVIPEQSPFALIPLCFCATHSTAEGTAKDPFA